ncbi:MAG: hypothetical protein ACI8WB_004757 [Phenylobacterium sp.]|jgi:hypothetical protein
MTDNTDNSLNRRDFLAGLGGVAATALLGGFGLPMPAFGAQRKLEMAPRNAKIHSVGIYPPIGISRVGLSHKTFAAPEVPGCAPNPPGGFKHNGELKRQVQRFFIFAFDKKGRIIKEITHTNKSSITWQVHVANSKAAWFGFNNPFDLGPSAPGIPAQLRNESIISQADRVKNLIIDAGEHSIKGTGINPGGTEPAFQLDGKFWQTQKRVHLAAMQTDGEGRLQVIPASGVSDSVINNNPIVDFTKNDAWYDDWCDGTVKATVEIDGQVLTAKPAWIACVGPNFAPEIPPFTSMYDTISDGMIKKYQQPQFKGNRKFTKPKTLSFTKDIYPLFYRLGMMQWVSGAAATRQGWIDVGDFASVDYIKTLANKRNKKERDRVFKAFRNPQSPDIQQYGIPYMVGSGIDYDSSPKHWYNMPDYQYWILTQWHDGNYDNDFTGEPEQAPCSIDKIDLVDQPEALTRAALEPLSGGNFHPGVELTWVLGHGQLFDDDEPFRIKLGDRPSLYQDIGPLITVDKVFPPTEGDFTPNDYPIGPQMPGDLTRWMGLPWQPDAFSCQNVNFANDFPTVVWWPALLPVDVLPEFAYQQMWRVGQLSREERLKFATVRAPWARGAAGIGYHANASYFDGLNRMVYLVDKMGVVVKKETPPDLISAENGLPEFVFVEVDRGSMDLEFNEAPNLGLGGS